MFCVFLRHFLTDRHHIHWDNVIVRRMPSHSTYANDLIGLMLGTRRVWPDDAGQDFLQLYFVINLSRKWKKSGIFKAHPR